MGNAAILRSGQASGDISTATEVLAATTGAYFIQWVIISASAAANITIKDSDGTALMGPYYFSANGGGVFGPFDQGAIRTEAGKGVDAISSTADPATVTVIASII